MVLQVPSGCVRVGYPTSPDHWQSELSQNELQIKVGGNPDSNPFQSTTIRFSECLLFAVSSPVPAWTANLTSFELNQNQALCNLKTAKNCMQTAASQPARHKHNKRVVVLMIPNALQVIEVNFCHHLNDILKCTQHQFCCLAGATFVLQLRSHSTPPSAEFPNVVSMEAHPQPFTLVKSHIHRQSIFHYGAQ